MGPTGEGLWLPYGLNEVLKFGRYRPGCYFKAHRDGPWAPSIDEMSVFTLVIYLCVFLSKCHILCQLSSLLARLAYRYCVCVHCALITCSNGPSSKEKHKFYGGTTRFFDDSVRICVRGVVGVYCVM